MKNPFLVVTVITVMAILASCGATTKEITRMSQSERADVFTEIVSEGSAPTGYAHMVIRASLKTPLDLSNAYTDVLKGRRKARSYV
jgi:hypothetical protein